MANQQDSYTVSQGTGTGNRDFPFTFPSFTEGEVKVEIDNVVKTLTTHYTVVNHNSTSGGTVRFNTTGLPNGTAGTTPVRIFRQTDVENPKATFTAGASLKAGEINDNFKQVRHALQEAIGALATDRKVQRFNIEADAIDGTLIADDVVDSEHFVAGSIDLEHMSANSVDSDQYVDGSIDLIHMSPNSVDSDQYVDGSIDLIHMSANSVDSDQYVDGSIDRVHLEADIIDSTKLADNAVDSEHYVDGSIDRIHLEADIIDSTKLADNAVNSEHYVDGSIDHVHLSNDCIDGDNIQNDVINSEHYVAGSIDHEHLSNDCVDEDNIQDNAVRSEHIQANAVTDSEIATGTLDNRYYTETELNNGQLDNRYYTEAELNGGQLNSLYFTEAELTGGAIDGRYYTETELNAGQLDNRYFTETELTGGALDGRYYTETEAEAKFLRQDSSETIASGVTWSSTDSKVATTAAIDARIIDLLDDVGGFVPLANETSFPTANPDINNGNGTVVSVKAVSTNLTPSSGTVTIANGAGTGNTVTITGVTGVIPQGFGMILETTSTLHTYAFHRLQAKATEVNTVATNIGNVIACGQNLTDIENFADLYQIATSAPTTRADGTSLTVGDLWFDSSSNQVMMVYDGSSGDGFSPITPNAATITNINTVAGHVTFSEDLGLITDAINTGSGNNSINTVGAAIANVNTTATNIAKIQTVADDLNETTSEIDTVATSITNVNTVGNNIGNVNTVANNIANVNAVKNNETNINAVNANQTNINAVAANNTNITAVKNNATNINTVAGINANVTTVAGIAANVTAVAGNNANITAVKNNETNINAVKNNSTNINAVANNASNINAAVSNATNINAAVSNASNINSVVSNATNINTVSSNISQVNSFANLYRIASSDPGSNNDQGDLYFNTTSNELRVYNGSTWQGGVTATGNLAGLGANTFTGNQTVNANIIVSGTVDGVDIAALKTSKDALSTTNGNLLPGVLAHTHAQSENSNKIATTSYVRTAVANVLDSAPSALDTLNELAAALNDDANFATTVNNSIATKAPINNPSFTGTVTAGTITGSNLTLDFGTL